MQNYFELFSLEALFDIDTNALEKEYQIQISNYHPDKFATKTEKEKTQALQNTSLINSAFETLKSPLLRATYLLELNGINAFDEKDTQMNMEFLMSQIELREHLEVIKEQKDSIALNDFIDRIKLFIKDKILSISDAFINLCDFKLATALVRELKFYEQLNTDANSLMDEWL